MKPEREIIVPDKGSSIKLAKYTSWDNAHFPNWHYHPEYEIVYIEKGIGFLHIGNYRSNYENGGLIFLGPNLPHTSFGNQIEGNVEIVLQFDGSIFNGELLNTPEMVAIKQLMEFGHHGVIFSRAVKKRVGDLLKEMIEKPMFDRMLSLLEIMKIMANPEEHELLNASSLNVKEIDYGRVNIIYEYVNNHYRQPIDLNQVAGIVNLTVPAFCRFFKKITGKTFNQFLVEFRVSLACQLLGERNKSIAQVSLEAGFGDVSNFNRQFRKVTNSTPTDFRKSLTKSYP